MDMAMKIKSMKLRILGVCAGLLFSFFIDTDAAVTLQYGSVIALKHANTGSYLVILPLKYKSASGKYILAGAYGSSSKIHLADRRAHWVVEGDGNDGDIVKNNDIIRLRSLDAVSQEGPCYISAFGYRGTSSPASGQGEAYGDEAGHHAKLKVVYRDNSVKFIFVASKSYADLHSHDVESRYNGINYKEVTAYFDDGDSNSKWIPIVVQPALPGGKKLTFLPS